VFDSVVVMDDFSTKEERASKAGVVGKTYDKSFVLVRLLLY
jgi:hypothetical protein